MIKMFNKKLFGKTLKIYRLSQYHNLASVSIMTGISISTLHRYEYGKSEPSINNIMTLCHTYLKMPVDVFVSENKISAPYLLDTKSLQIFTSLTTHLKPVELAHMIRMFNKCKTISDLLEFDTIPNTIKGDHYA